LAGREMDAAGDLLVEENVLHRPQDERVEANGELPAIAATGVGGEDLVELFGGGTAGFDGLSISEHQPPGFARRAAEKWGGVELDDPVDALADWGGEDLAVGDVALAVAGDGGDGLDGKREVGLAGAPDAHSVGRLHPFLQRLHGPAHAGVVHGADVEVEVL